MICFDPFELPVVALEDEVEVNLGITGQFDFYVFGELVLILHHDFYSELLGLVESLYRLRFFLYADGEEVLVAINDLAVFADSWVLQVGHAFHLKHFHHRTLKVLLHLYK